LKDAIAYFKVQPASKDFLVDEVGGNNESIYDSNDFKLPMFSPIDSK
jgi:hypothetical protein